MLLLTCCCCLFVVIELLLLRLLFSMICFWFAVFVVDLLSLMCVCVCVAVVVVAADLLFLICCYCCSCCCHYRFCSSSSSCSPTHASYFCLVLFLCFCVWFFVCSQDSQNNNFLKFQSWCDDRRCHRCLRRCPWAPAPWCLFPSLVMSVISLSPGWWQS